MKNSTKKQDFNMRLEKHLTANIIVVDSSRDEPKEMPIMK